MENKEWKPEFGNAAWYLGHGAVTECIVERYATGDSGIWVSTRKGQVRWRAELEDLFPTAEAALQSIKVYGLDGVEIPRASEIPVHFTGVCGECHNKIELSEEEDTAFQRVVRIAYSLPTTPNPEGEARLKKAQERFKNLDAGENKIDESHKDWQQGRDGF